MDGTDLHGAAVVALQGAPWKIDPADPFGPDHVVGKAIAATVRGAGLLVYAVADLAAKTPTAETGLVREYTEIPVGFLPEMHGKPTNGLGPILLVSDAAFDRTLAKATAATYADWQKKLSAGSAKPLRTGIPIALSIDAKPNAASASNVVAMMRGTEPRAP